MFDAGGPISPVDAGLDEGGENGAGSSARPDVREVAHPRASDISIDPDSRHSRPRARACEAADQGPGTGESCEFGAPIGDGSGATQDPW